ncbi:hypothetical protein [Flavobacterium sp.]|uniref:hypothetical protein n=1 Tax=Flavobacterium sp. TaxID=239 RepID=UPI002608FD68|nr:hypothetical protein [Flavobacterium sp.]
MKNLTELNQFELNTINGGTESPSFAYRVGQGIRYLSYLSLTHSSEYAYNMSYGLWD